MVSVSITKNYDTALHIASSTKHSDFVEKLVDLMNPEDLFLQNKNCNTALCLAAVAGTVKSAEIMVGKEPGLLKIHGNHNMSPLLMAALFGHKDIVSFLYSKMSDKDWTGKERITLLHACVSENLYDVALQLLEVEHHKKELALTTDKNALLVLAKNPPVFAGTRQSVFWRLLNTVSDFHGDPSCVAKTVKSGFKVLAHNIETVEEQQSTVQDHHANFKQFIDV